MPSFAKKAMLYLGLGPDDEYEDYDQDEPVERVEPAARPPRTAGAGTTRTSSSRSTSRPTAPKPPSASSSPRPAPSMFTSPAVEPLEPSRASSSGTNRPAPPPARTAKSASRPASAAKPPPPSQASSGAAGRSASRSARPAPKPTVKPRPSKSAPPPPSSSESARLPDAPKPRPVVRAVPANAKPHIVAPVDFNAAQEVADKFKTDQPVVMDLRMVDGKLARRLLDFSSGVCYSLGGGMEKLGSKVYLLVPEGTEVSSDERRRLYDRGLSD